MSELKAFDVVLGRYSEDGSPCVVAIDADRNPRELNEKVYLKSEADRVIAEKDKELRHHKYKRCLDKAEMCDAKYDEEDAKVNGRGASWDYTSEEMKYWQRWRNRWLVLADKFKEVK